MENISSDTNVWIDFYSIDKLHLPFKLPYTYIMYTKKHDDDALDEYHHELPFYYDEDGRKPSDEDLDKYIYS